MPTNQEKLVLLFEAQNKDVLRKLNQIERSSSRAFNNSRKPLKAFSRDMRQAANSARGFAAAFAGGFTGVLVAGGIAGLPGIVRDVVAETSKLGKVADRVNLTTDALQRLRFGFELTAGVASNQTDVAMQRFSRRVAQAANGTGELYEILNQNGVALRNQDGGMRSQINILRDYANLIKGARSEQERLLLAFKAFDTEGAGLVNALRGGAAGLDTLMEKADEAGGVLEESLVREAEKIDDQFAKVWRNFETNSKSAILRSVGFLGQLQEETKALSSILQDVLPQGLAEYRAGLILNERLGGGLSGRSVNDGIFFRGDIGLRETNPAEVTVTRPTVLPQKRDASSKAADRQAESVKRLIAALELEQAAIGKTALEQRVMNELSRAGEGATDAQREQIRSLVAEIERQHATQERVNELTEFGGQLIQSQFGVITDAINTGNAALDRFLQTMIDASLQAALLGQGPLASLLGGGGSGGGLLSLLGFGGFRANGGDVQSGRGYIVGEKGPELIVPKSAGTVIPSHALGGGTTYAPSYHIDARGSNLSEADFRRIIEENNRTVVPQIAQASVGKANRLNTSSSFRGR